MSAPALDVDSTRQAGGGASSLMQATPTLNSTSLGYLKEIFNSHAGPDEQWSAGQINRFITQVQQNDETTEAAKHLLAKGDVDFNSFLQYMASQDSALTLPWKECDLSWPLSSYFISSSHNTYLSGNQLSSASTTEAYTNVLKRGCRCVEVDVWDGQEGEGDNSSLSSASSEDEGGEGTAKPGMLKRQGTFNKLKSKFPNSLTSRFEKSSIGKRIEQKVSGGKHESKPAAAAASATEKPKPADNSASASSAAATAEERQHPLEVGVVEPRVLHGYTLTKEISFRDVCNAIRESAFAVTDLPLIISLEVHCDHDQQLMMASIMKEAWAGMLVTEDEIQKGTLPSPSQLKRKILIKVKYAPPETPAAAAARKSQEERESVDADSDDDDRMPEEAAAAAKKKSKIRQELSKMGIYTQAVSFKAWTQPEASMPTHIFSLSEKKYIEHRDKHPKELFQHNRDYLLRAYPSGLRIRSTNLMPTTFWGTGAQIVALNWQQNDDGMMLNEGMFAGTGGYVLKPEGYRSNSDSRSTPNSAIPKYKLNLTITCLAAQSIPLPKGDTSPKKFHPYVKAELHVDASDSRATGRPDSSDSNHDHEVRHKSRTKTHQGCDVDLGGQKLSFTEISGLVEELTFVRFVIRDDELGLDDLAAWACVRLDRLGQGYRFVHLLDSKGNLTEGNILVKVEKELREESASDEGGVSSAASSAGA